MRPFNRLGNMPLNFVFTDFINRENETPLHETSLVAKALAGANVV